MKDLLLILNPCAGQRRANRFLPEIVRACNEAGYRCEVYVTGAQGDATDYLLSADKHYDRILCIGGDGTLNETVAGVLGAQTDTPIGYIPAGSTNDFASSIGLSSDILTAANDALHGQVMTQDIGTFNSRFFTYTATCGAFARTSYSTPQAVKNVLGHLAYILEGIKDLGTLRPMHMIVEAGGKTIEGDFIFCSITNSTSVGGILKLDEQLVALNDGLFEVTLVRHPANPAQLAQILSALKSMNIPNDMIEFFPADTIRVQTAQPVEWTLDGERGPETDTAELKNIHSAVSLVLPAAKEAVSNHADKDQLRD